MNDFEVIIPGENDRETLAVSTGENIESLIQSGINYFLSQKSKGNLYSANLSTETSSRKVELADIDRLAVSPQDDLAKTTEIIKIIKRYVNMNDIIGKVVESITVNVNTTYNLSYDKLIDAKRPKKSAKQLDGAKSIINGINQNIKLERLIRDVVPRVYQEGTVISYLRKKEDEYIVDIYPVGIGIISPYSIDGEPIVLINVDELVQRLESAGVAYTNRRGANMFFNSIATELKANYPPEVYKAYSNGESYAKLDPRYSGVIRFGANGGKYGLSPLFRALKGIIMLDTFAETDEAVAKINARRIIFQIMNEILLGDNGEKRDFDLYYSAHGDLIKAVNSGKVTAYTGNPAVKDLKFVEPKAELTNINNITYYQNKVLSTLGIGFLSTSDSSQTISSANISLEQLMRTINAISEGLELVLEKWYKVVLEDEGYDDSFAPKIKIIDSEALEMKVRIEWAQFLYTMLNCSLETTLNMVGLDLADEKAKREKENEDKIHEIFFPRSTAYTSSGKGEILPTEVNGRPQNDPNSTETDVDKQIYDNERNGGN